MKKPAFLIAAAALLMATSSVTPAQAEELTVACSLQGSFTTVGDAVTRSSNDCSGAVVIPAYVKTINEFAFAEKRTITSVEFEAGSQLEVIRAWAFQNTSFTSIELPQGLKLIDYHAFYATKFLSIRIPASVETLGASFRYSSLESVVFEPRGGSILPAGGGFDESQNLKSVTYLGAYEFTEPPFQTESPSQIEKAAHDWVGWSLTEGGPLVTFPLSVGPSGVTFFPNFLPRTYNATFDSNGGSSVEPALIVGGQIDFPTPPTRDGYAFMGWSDSDQPGASIFTDWYRNNDAAFYAVWAPRYPVSLDPKGGALSSDSSFVAVGEIASAPSSPSRPGYSFSGWSTSENGSPLSFPYRQEGLGALTLFAKWFPNTLVANIDTNGGSEVPSLSFVTGGEIEFEPDTPTRAGYTFAGWSTTRGGEAISFPYYPTATEDMTLYAEWILTRLVANIDTNGGSEVPSLSFVTGGEIEFAPETPFRAGYTFAGWSTTQGGEVISFPYYPTATENMTLYAEWILNTLVANIDANGGSDVPSLNFVAGGEIESAPETPIRAGYTFAGWSTTQGGEIVSFPYFPTATEDMTFYAKWTRDIIYHSVNFDSTGGSFVERIIYAEDTPIEYAPWEPEREAYTFAGWSATENGAVISFPYTPAEKADITLYAKWAPILNYYSLYFDPMNGSDVQRISFTQGIPIESPPEEPVLENYTFEGWSETEDGQVVSFPYTPTSTGNVVLYAKWSLTSFFVNFNSNGGSAVAALPFLPGWFDIDKAPAMPTRQGYRFAGWFKAGSASEVTFPYSPGVAENITLFAKWTAINLKAAATVKPTISGTAKIKSKLTAKPGTWTGAPVPKLAYQWFSCTKAVTAATATVPKTCKALTGKTSTTLT